MSDDDSSDRRRPEIDRRGALKLLGGGALAASGARVGYEVTGYGTLTGTNVTEQRLEPFVRENLEPRPFELSLADGRLAFDGSVVAYEADGSQRAAVAVDETTPDEAAAAGEDHGVGDQFREVVGDLRVLAAGDPTFEFSGVDAFFERIEGATPRPFTVAALRGDDFGSPERETLKSFTGVDPTDADSLVTGLAEGFRDHAHFDVARWIVRNVEDHVLLNTVPLGWLVSEPTSFEALESGSTGLYCWEYTRRSLAAFHSIPPHEQSPPVFGAIVTDDRHNHMYTALASVVRDGDDLVVPMTFVDYSHSTMYDSYWLQWALGPGVDAYAGSHRVTGVRYTW